MNFTRLTRHLTTPHHPPLPTQHNNELHTPNSPSHHTTPPTAVAPLTTATLRSTFAAAILGVLPAGSRVTFVSVTVTARRQLRSLLAPGVVVVYLVESSSSWQTLEAALSGTASLSSITAALQKVYPAATAAAPMVVVLAPPTAAPSPAVPASAGGAGATAGATAGAIVAVLAVVGVGIGLAKYRGVNVREKVGSCASGKGRGSGRGMGSGSGSGMDEGGFEGKDDDDEEKERRDKRPAAGEAYAVAEGGAQGPAKALFTRLTGGLSRRDSKVAIMLEEEGGGEGGYSIDADAGTAAAAAGTGRAKLAVRDEVDKAPSVGVTGVGKSGKSGGSSVEAGWRGKKEGERTGSEAVRGEKKSDADQQSANQSLKPSGRDTDRSAVTPDLKTGNRAVRGTASAAVAGSGSGARGVIPPARAVVNTTSGWAGVRKDSSAGKKEAKEGKEAKEAKDQEQEKLQRNSTSEVGLRSKSSTPTTSTHPTTPTKPAATPSTPTTPSHPGTADVSAVSRSLYGLFVRPSLQTPLDPSPSPLDPAGAPGNRSAESKQTLLKPSAVAGMASVAAVAATSAGSSGAATATVTVAPYVVTPFAGTSLEQAVPEEAIGARGKRGGTAADTGTGAGTATAKATGAGAGVGPADEKTRKKRPASDITSTATPVPLRGAKELPPLAIVPTSQQGTGSGAPAGREKNAQVMDDVRSILQAQAQRGEGKGGSRDDELNSYSNSSIGEMDRMDLESVGSHSTFQSNLNTTGAKQGYGQGQGRGKGQSGASTDRAKSTTSATATAAATTVAAAKYASATATASAKPSGYASATAANATSTATPAGAVTVSPTNRVVTTQRLQELLAEVHSDRGDQGGGAGKGAAGNTAGNGGGKAEKSTPKSTAKTATTAATKAAATTPTTTTTATATATTATKSTAKTATPAAFAAPPSGPRPFKALSRSWFPYTTEDGYDYFLTTDPTSGEVHSQWDDPRTHGFVEEYAYGEEG